MEILQYEHRKSKAASPEECYPSPPNPISSGWGISHSKLNKHLIKTIMQTSQFTHFNAAGDAHMVDVSDKNFTTRTAITEGFISLEPKTLEMILQGGHKKGDVLGIARIAGIMASKRTADLIPLCHPLPLTHVEITLTPEPENKRIRCQTIAKTHGQTGVEMEALTATTCALLTIYDMCKAVDRGMVISGVRLLEKIGGKSGHWRVDETR